MPAAPQEFDDRGLSAVIDRATLPSGLATLSQPCVT
jgi:hypothetical protein